MPLDATLAPAVCLPAERPGFIDVFGSREEALQAMSAVQEHGLGLAGRTLQSLEAFFATKGHRPSEDHWTSLWAIAATLEGMAEGRGKPKIHLSPCDPGVGKSQTLVHFGRALVTDPDYRHVGMFVSAFTIAEVRALAEALADVRGSVCVMTSNDAANEMGGATAAEAQILITTQSRLGKLTAERPFASVASFHYLGAPRSVRVWDESLLPGSTVVIEADAVIGMASRLRKVSAGLTDALLDFGAALRRCEDGEAVTVPDFEGAFGLAFETLTAHLAAEDGTEARSRDRDTAASLRIVNDCIVRVRRDGRNGSAMLTYKEELPSDLPPMLVLDASGRVRETYALWQASRQALEMLPAATRDYSPLAVKLWKTAGSKSGWEKGAERLIEGIAVTIESKPDEAWLLVTHRPTPRITDLRRELKRRLDPTLFDKLAFTTWGRHVGVNDWADIPNVILAGTLFYPDSLLTSLHHLCADRPVEDGLASLEEVHQTRLGEHRHLILQAACRGRARRSDGDRCQPMTLYIVASPKSGIAAELPSIFPGCRVGDWKPLKVKATGKTAEAIAALTTMIEEGRSEVSYAEVYTAVGMEKGNFLKRVAKSDEWRDAVAELGAEIVRGPRSQLFVRLVDRPD